MINVIGGFLFTELASTHKLYHLRRFCVLLIAYCLLPIAYCLLPVVFLKASSPQISQSANILALFPREI